MSDSPQSTKHMLKVCQLCRLFTWEVDLDLTKLLVLRSKQVESFKTVQRLGDSSLSASAPAQAVDEKSKQTEVNGV